MSDSNPQKPTDEFLLLIRGTHWNGAQIEVRPMAELKAMAVA